MKTMIGLPTNRVVKPKTAKSLLRMIANTKHEIVSKVEYRGYNTAENRNKLAVQSIKEGCTHLFLVDDDMVYGENTINALAKLDKDIVGGLYKTKYEDRAYVLEGEVEKRLFECTAIGGGLLLIKTEVFKKMAQPHFGYKWFGNGMVKQSNDWFFCYKAREFGYKIYCDPFVRAGHIGLKEF